MPVHRSPSLTRRELDYRVVKVRSASADADKRSVELDIATEAPVIEYDWKRGTYVPRVLLSSGAMFPKTRQVPLLDSHSRFSVRSQLGSLRGLTRHRDSGRVSGTAVFSSVAQDEFTKVREGHVTDASAGFSILKEEYVAEGESRIIDGKAFTGPVNVATKWRLYEGSIVPIGADEMAKMRGLDPSQLYKPKEEEITVNPELRALCVSKGMDSKLNDAEALKWLNDNHARVFAAPAPTPVPTPVPIVTPAAVPSTADIARQVSDTVMQQLEARDVLRAQQQREQREAFERDVNATLTLLYGETVDQGIRSTCLALPTMEAVRTHLGELKKRQEAETQLGGGGYVTPTGNQRDTHRSLLRTAYMVRSFEAASPGMAERQLPMAQRQQGWDQFRNLRLIDFARECLLSDGYSWNELRGLSPESLAKAAMGWPEKVGLRSGGYAYHTTGSLAIITMDAINKTLLAGYGEAPQTWRGPMRQAASVADFKQIHRIKLSAVGNLPIWNDNTVPKEAAMANEEEKYAVEARALMITFSWRLLVNDDMDSLARTPALMGDAAGRTVNAVAWAAVTSNPTMSDGQALFLAAATGNRKRSNLTTGSATPTVATLGAMKNKMRQMRGLNTPEGNESEDILNLEPSYIAIPSALETTVAQLLTSIADPAASQSGVANIFRGSLIPVIEPRLDADSTTAWYLFASPSRIDTAEVTFLQGQETPVTGDFVNERTWSREISIVQTFAAKAIDHRGVQKHAGA